MAYKIYLCGGMTGLSVEEQKDWRREVRYKIYHYAKYEAVTFFDPTEYDATEEHIFGKQRAEELSMKLDIRNLVESDLVICNISSNPRSVGTNIELGIAHNLEIPVVIYNPTVTPLHPWQDAISDCQLADMDKLVEIIKEYYLPRSSRL